MSQGDCGSHSHCILVVPTVLDSSWTLETNEPQLQCCTPWSHADKGALSESISLLLNLPHLKSPLASLPIEVWSTWDNRLLMIFPINTLNILENTSSEGLDPNLAIIIRCRTRYSYRNL